MYHIHISIMKLLSFIVVILVTLSCNTEIQEAVQSTDSLLINCWIHSHEEDYADDIDLYRLCDAGDLPISRFRKTLDLRMDGTATYLVLSPIDAHYTEEGTWSYLTESQTLEILQADGKIHLSKLINVIDENTLELKDLK